MKRAGFLYPQREHLSERDITKLLSGATSESIGELRLKELALCPPGKEGGKEPAGSSHVVLCEEVEFFAAFPFVSILPFFCWGRNV